MASNLMVLKRQAYATQLNNKFHIIKVTSKRQIDPNFNNIKGVSEFNKLIKYKSAYILYKWYNRPTENYYIRH